MARPQDQYSSIYYATLIASIGGFLAIYAIVTTAATLPFLTDWFDLNLKQQEIVVSSIIAVAAVGSLIGGLICSWLGRKKAIIIAAFIFILASILACFSDTFSLLIISRYILGLAIGITFVSVPFYICEIAPANIRGSCLCVTIMEFYLGSLMGYLVARSISFSVGWQAVLLTPIIPALGLIIGMYYMPETPQWLYGKGKKEKAYAVLKRLRRFLDIDYEIEALESSSQFSHDRKSKLLGGGVVKAIVIGAIIAILMEANGGHAVYYYMPQLFIRTLDWAKRSAIDVNLTLGFVSFVVSIVAMVLVDRLGRRKLLMWGFAIMGFSLFLLGILFHNLFSEFLHQGLIIFLLCLFVAGFVLGVGSIGFLIVCEIFPLKIRSLMISSVLALKWLTSYIVTRTFLFEFETYGGMMTFWGYALISVGGLIFTYYCVPETTGISLEIIEEYWLEDREYDFKITE